MSSEECMPFSFQSFSAPEYLFCCLYCFGDIVVSDAEVCIVRFFDINWSWCNNNW